MRSTEHCADKVTVRVLISVTIGSPPYPPVTVVVSVLVEMTVDTLAECGGGGGGGLYPSDDDGDTVIVSVLVAVTVITLGGGLAG
jgi:hypothetical protein